MAILNRHSLSNHGQSHGAMARQTGYLGAPTIRISGKWCSAKVQPYSIVLDPLVLTSSPIVSKASQNSESQWQGTFDSIC